MPVGVLPDLISGIGAAFERCGPAVARVTQADGLWHVVVNVRAPAGPQTWRLAAEDPDVLVEQAILAGARRERLWRDPAGTARLTAPARGPSVLLPATAAVLLHEAIGHTSEADNYLDYGHLLGYDLGDRVTSADLDVWDDPLAPWPGRHETDDEGTPSVAVPLLRGGVWSGLLTDQRSSGALDRSNSGHGRRGPSGVVPRCSVLRVGAGIRTGEELIAAVQDGWLIGPPTGGGSVRDLVLVTVEWLQRVVGGRPVGDRLRGPGHIRVRKRSILRRIAEASSDIEVICTGDPCTKNDHAVVNAFLCPHLLLNDCVVVPTPLDPALLRADQPAELVS